MIKAGLILAGKLTVELIKIGGLTTVQQWANQEVRNNTNHLIGEVKRGGEHTAIKLKLIKND